MEKRSQRNAMRTIREFLLCPDISEPEKARFIDSVEDLVLGQFWEGNVCTQIKYQSRIAALLDEEAEVHLLDLKHPSNSHEFDERKEFNRLLTSICGLDSLHSEVWNDC